MSGSHPYRRPAAQEQEAGPSSAPSDSSSSSHAPRTRTKAHKRIRGEIACAECRRLKVKCDRTIPCSTCVKRGCAALCPNGTIPPGEGSRFVLAATEHLEHRRATMEARMHALEDALAILHSTQSDDTHPLLLESLEEEPFEPSPEDLAADQEASGTPAEEALPTRSVGALHMDELGSSRFYGPSGGSESLLLDAKDLDVPSTRAAPQELDPTYLGPEINNAYNSFPFTPPGMAVSAVQSAIESFLPSVERAVTLIDTMLEHLSWMFRIVSRAEIMNTVLPAVYKQDSSLSYGPHELSLLLSVLALGALVDLTQGPYNLEAQHYYHLTRAAISLQPVLTDQSMATVKTLHLMSLYNGMSGQESALEPTYNLLSMAGQAALRIGAHIDPSMWQFTGQEAYERRAYFWNLLAAIMWQSLVTGRPPIILSTFIDCRIPTSEEEELYQEGEVPVGFGVWGYRASVACLVPLVLTTLSTNTPSYAKILEVDKQIRDFFGVARDSTAESERTSAAMRVFVRSHYEDLMMLFLHRGCFAEAMAYPNPLRSPYAPSVQAAYKSACIVLADTQEHYAKNPMLLSRVWRIWSNAFSAAVVVGTVARKGVQLSGMPDPFEQLDSAVELFRKASGSSSRAERGLPVLEIMRQKALQAKDAASQPATLPSEGPDPLSVFGGQSRYVTSSTPIVARRRSQPEQARPNMAALQQQMGIGSMGYAPPAPPLRHGVTPAPPSLPQSGLAATSGLLPVPGNIARRRTSHPASAMPPPQFGFPAQPGPPAQLRGAGSTHSSYLTAGSNFDFDWEQLFREQLPPQPMVDDQATSSHFLSGPGMHGLGVLPGPLPQGAGGANPGTAGGGRGMSDDRDRWSALVYDYGLPNGSGRGMGGYGG